MDFVPDYKIAQKRIKCGGFSKYSKAYVITNEDLRESMRFVPKNCNRALTVAGSGDHPLFCSLYGAKHVDTFDICYHAKCITDIKVAAIKTLNYEECWNLLRQLYKESDITAVDNIEKISALLPHIEYDYLCAMKNFYVFRQGLHPDVYSMYFPTVEEYEKLHDIVTKHYNFILSDIKNLSANLTQFYDFMHVSNIFDYIPVQERTDIILALLKHINVGGRMLIHDQVIGGSVQACKNIARSCDNWCFAVPVKGLNILERVR